MNNGRVKIYIINLKKDKEKKDYMEKLLKRCDVKFEFIEATYGKKLTENEINLIYSSQEAKKSIYRELSLSEIGCALSHKSIYEKIVKKDIEKALVLEDDIEFDSELFDLIEKQEMFPKNWELILLGHHGKGSRYEKTITSIWWQKNVYNNFILKKPTEVSRGTYGYLINKRGAKKLLDLLDKIRMPIDHYTGNSQFINLYVIEPVLININDYMSDEMQSITDRNNLTIVVDKKKLILKKIIKNIGIYKVIKFILKNLKRITFIKKYS